MTYTNALDYQAKFDNLKNGYYEYYVCGEHLNLLTVWDQGIPWIRVVEVDWNNNDHINDGAVQNIKPDDEVINLLRTSEYEYNVCATVDRFQVPTNLWLNYPHIMYVHQSMERFSSTSSVLEIPNSNCISFDQYQPPHKVDNQWDVNTVGFGTTQGDQYFAYGRTDRNGFVQDFSGAGKGVVYVR